MSADAAANCEQLRRMFEGREAILVEKGVVRVRVSDIQPKPAERRVEAQVDALPTRGLPAGALYYHAAYRAGRGMRIAGGPKALFSEQEWDLGYGGCTLYFAPLLVKGVVDLAATWPDSLDPDERYAQVHSWMSAHFPMTASIANLRRVFPKAG